MARITYQHLNQAFSSLLELSKIPDSKYILPKHIDQNETRALHLRAIFSKILFNEYKQDKNLSDSDQAFVTFGNHYCRRCHSRLIIPPTGQFIRQTRRGDEPASILLHCQTCNENQII